MVIKRNDSNFWKLQVHAGVNLCSSQNRIIPEERFVGNKKNVIPECNVGFGPSIGMHDPKNYVLSTKHYYGTCYCRLITPTHEMFPRKINITKVFARAYRALCKQYFS